MAHPKARHWILLWIFSGVSVAVFGRVHQGARPTEETLRRGESGETAVTAVSCGRPNDGKPYLPPDWTTFRPPKVGESYLDPVFGCQVKRLTDSSTEETLEDGTHPSFTNFYSTLTTINATDSLIFICADNGTWRIKDLDGHTVVPFDKIPRMNNGHPVWDASNGSIFYYTLGRALYKGTVERNSVKSTELHKFEEYSGIGSPDTADLSQDGDHIALAGQNGDKTIDVFVWSLSKQVKTSIYKTSCKVNQWGVTETPQPGCVHKVLLTADNLLAIDFTDDGSGPEQGVRLWNGSNLVHLQDTTNHLDTGFDLNGNPIFISMANRSTLPGLKNPCPSGWGLDVRQQRDLLSATCLLDKQPSWHVSYRGSVSQPWAAISFFDDRRTGPELFNNNPRFQPPSPRNWALYEDEIILARIDGRAIYRLADARSRSAEGYWYQPHAAISRDGKYVVFTSSMAYPNGCKAKMHVADECTDVYLIRVR